MSQVELWCESLYKQDKLVDTFNSREEAEDYADYLVRIRRVDPYECFTIREVKCCE